MCVCVVMVSLCVCCKDIIASRSVSEMLAEPISQLNILLHVCVFGNLRI